MPSPCTIDSEGPVSLPSCIDTPEAVRRASVFSSLPATISTKSTEPQMRLERSSRGPDQIPQRSETMFDTFTFETSTKKPDPRWQAAHRFARALRSEGFLARRHFIDRIAERGWGSGVRFDPPFYNDSRTEQRAASRNRELSRAEAQAALI